MMDIYSMRTVYDSFRLRVTTVAVICILSTSEGEGNQDWISAPDNVLTWLWLRIALFINSGYLFTLALQTFCIERNNI